MQSLSKYDQFAMLKLIKQEAPAITHSISIPKRHPTNTSDTYEQIYDAIRSGNTEVFEKTLQNSSSSESEAILSSAYEELKIRNVPLTFEIQVCVENVLLKQKIFTNKTNQKQQINYERRIAFLKECFEDLKQQNEYNEMFIFIVKFIAKNLRILKRQLKRKPPFSKLPWEEMEFCMIAFIRSKHGLEEHDFLTRMIMSKCKTLQYLEKFLECLSNSHLLDFTDLLSDFYLIKDIYSLNRILSYVEHAVSAKLDKTGKLVIERALQVMGEYLKNTSDSLHISKSVEERLVESAPKQLKEIITSLRDSLSHTHTLSKKILVEHDARKELFEGIQNDFKKVANEITVIILDLKFEICKAFLKKLTNAENQTDLVKIYEEVVPFWYEDISYNKYETEEWKLNIALLENMEKDPQRGSQAVFDFVNLKVKEISNNEDAYLTLLKYIHYIGEVLEKNFCFTKSVFDAMTDIISLEKQTIKESAQIGLVADAVRKFSDADTVLTNKIFNCSSHFGKKIKHIDRFNAKVTSEIKYEQEINSIFQQIEECMKDNKQTVKQIDTFWRNVNQKRDLHATKEEILEKLYVGSSEELMSLIEELKMDKKATENCKNAFKEGRLDDFKQEIKKKVFDPFAILLRDLTKANFFMCDTFKAALKLFFKKAVPLPESIINDFISKTIRKIQNYLVDRLETLKSISPADEVAVETIMLDIGEIYNSLTPDFDGFCFLDADITILAGKYLRNYLAHGDPLVDVLEYDPKVSLHCHKHNFLHNARSLTSLEGVLFGYDIFSSIEELEQRYSRGLGFAINQHRLFQEIEAGDVERVKICLQKGADPRGLKVDGKTVLHLSAASNNMDVFKIFLPKNTKIRESIWHIAVANKIQDTIVKVIDFVEFSSTLNGNFHAIEYLNKHDFNVNEILNAYITDTKNKSVLHKACEIGSFELARALVNNGTDTNAKISGNLTPLHIASMFGHDEIVKLLLQKGVEINCKSTSESTPLFYACFGNHKQCVELLLQAKADTNSGPVTPLTIASGRGHKDIVKLLLENGVPAVGRNTGALFEAALHGFEEIVNILLKFGVSVNEKFEDDFTALHVAAQNGHINVVRLLMEYKANIEAVTKENHTPLFAAAHNGYVDIVRLLLENKSDPNVVSKNGYKPIHSASHQGHAEVVQLLCNYITCEDDLNLALCLAVQNSHIVTTNVLLANKANPSAFVQIKSNSEYRFTALHSAILENNSDLVKILLDAGAVFTAISADRLVSTGETALHLAAKLGHFKVVILLLERFSGMVDVLDGVGKTPLFYAVSNGHKDVVQVLLKNSARLEASFLQKAVVSNYVDIVEALLKHQSDLICLDETLKFTSMSFAVSKGYLDIAEVLLQYGAKIEYLPQKKQYSPLHIACFAGNIESVRFLLKKGASVDICGNDNVTILQQVVRKAQEDIIKVLLEYGADCTKMNNHDSVLHQAVASKTTKIAELVINNIRKSHNDNFAEHINVRDADGDTPLMWAAENGLPEMVALLLINGAEVNLKNYGEMTAVDWAVKNNNWEVVQILIENGGIASSINCLDSL